jgi:putative Mn2+ efflux pump MntP
MLAKLIALVLPLGLDMFAVAAAIGMIGVNASERRRISLLFTGFEAGMPVIGLALGAPLGHAIGAAADYVAIGVLIAFGIYTLSSADEDNADSPGSRRCGACRPSWSGSVSASMSSQSGSHSACSTSLRRS